ncbi:MAG: histidine phosphatase family protein [Acetobacteraceae bacterium]
MRQLLLLRHAKSAWDAPELPDRERPLNGRGRRSAALMRDAMRERGLAPDLILVSSSRRTLQTLEALEPWDDTPLVEPMDTLYLAPAPQLLAALHEVAETVRSVLVIGHNPGLHDLALMLAAPPLNLTGEKVRRRLAEGFPTAALAEFTVTGTWSDLQPGGARLIQFLTPRTLEAAE